MTSSVASVPDTAFLNADDMPGQIKGTPERLPDGERPLPRFCGAAYEQTDRITSRATFRLRYTSAGAPPESTPKAEVYQDILVYRDAGAGAFMTALRAAVTGCASQNDDAGVPVANFLRGDIGAGDESALLEHARPTTDDEGNPAGDGSVQSRFCAVVRVGDAIAFLAVVGWESSSADRGDTVALGRKAAERLAAWRA
ncbi:hypothetical protein ACIA5D_26870 [Actinoplanes sp. NPDC051513]|uniref:hypothetical protein n=1 Tax=Actinoplanes sp. NPDC051513 TaxID=3363908 RepID=UPI00379C577A